MQYEIPAICPVCQGAFQTKKLACIKCGSVLEGNFAPDPLSALPKEMRQFILIFIRCRGNIREMEKAYGISYPTVRARLDEIIAALNVNRQPGRQAGVKPAQSANNGVSDGAAASDAGTEGMAGDTDAGPGPVIAVGDTDAGPGPDMAGGSTQERLGILKSLASGEIGIDEAKELLTKKGAGE